MTCVEKHLLGHKTLSTVRVPFKTTMMQNVPLSMLEFRAGCLMNILPLLRYNVKWFWSLNCPRQESHSCTRYLHHVLIHYVKLCNMSFMGFVHFHIIHGGDIPSTQEKSLKI